MTVNDRVTRLESREFTGALILAVDGDNALLAYDEGGQGWWPLACLELEQNGNAPGGI